MQAVQREMDGDARPHIGEVDVAESFNRAMAVALRRGGDRKGGEVGVEERGDGWEDLQQQEKLDWESEGCVEEKGVGGEGHAKETQKGLVPLLAGVQAALSVLMALSSSSPLFLDPSSSSPSVPSSHSIASSAPDSSDFSSNITIRVHRCEVISAQGRLRPYEVVRVVARLFAHQMQHSAGTSTAHTAKLLLDCFKQPLLRLQSDKDFHLYLTQEVFAEYMEEREDSIAGDSSQLPAACHADEFIATAEALAACNFALLNRRQHSLQIWQRFAPATTFSLQLRRGPSLSVTSHAGQATQHAWPTLFHRKRNSFPVARPSLPSLESHESMKARELQLCVRFPYDSDLLQLVEQLMEQNCHMLSPGALAPVPPPALVDRMRCRLDEVQSLLTQRLQHSFDRIFRSAAATVPHPSSAQDTAQNILPCPVSSSPTPSPLSPSSTAVDFIVRLEDLALCRRLRAALHIEDSRKAEDISLPLPSWLGNETEGGEPVLGPAETWKAVAEMLAPLAVAFVPKSWPAESAAGKAREWGNEGSGAWAVDVRFG